MRIGLRGEKLVMMWLVRLALNRPYTFIVASILILILSVVAVVRTPTDILPDINVPVVSVVWGYTGLAPEEMERRMVKPFERSRDHHGQRCRTH